MAGRLLVLTGPPGSGKTRRCLAVTAAARAVGLTVSGLLATTRREQVTAQRWLHDIRSGEQRLLGTENPATAVAAGEPRWLLRDDCLEWGDETLAAASPTDLLIIDEMGPIELVHHRGWLVGARQALAGPYRLALVVVRLRLLTRFQGLFPSLQAEVVDVSDIETLRARLAEVDVPLDHSAAGADAGSPAQDPSRPRSV